MNKDLFVVGKRIKIRSPRKIEGKILEVNPNSIVIKTVQNNKIFMSFSYLEKNMKYWVF